MKKIKWLFMVLFLATFALNSCSEDDSEEEEDSEFVGQDGNPRFNLQFTNSSNVDLDLYVQTPSGKTISYSNRTADLGTLDVDCMCNSCPQGPNENIYWENGTAPSGTYIYWIKYYSTCGGGSAESSYTLRIIRNGTVLETKTGSLSSGSTPQWTFSHAN